MARKYYTKEREQFFDYNFVACYRESRKPGSAGSKRKKKEGKKRKKKKIEKEGGEKKNKKYLAWHPSVCVHVHGPCTGLEWNYLLVIHVEWRTNGFDVKNERAFLLFPRRVTVVFLTA